MTSKYIFPFIKPNDCKIIEQWVKNNKEISILKEQGCWIGGQYLGWFPGYLLEIKNSRTEFLYKLTFQYIFPYRLSQNSAVFYD